MKYKDKERRLSRKAKQNIRDFLELDDWNSFYEDRMFGGQLFDEANKIEKDVLRRNNDGITGV